MEHIFITIKHQVSINFSIIYQHICMSRVDFIAISYMNSSKLICRRIFLKCSQICVVRNITLVFCKV